jgi:hypothetical protein
MDDVGLEVEQAAQLEGAAREEGEASEVIAEVAVGIAVDAVAVEEVVVLEEIDLHRVVGRGREAGLGTRSVPGFGAACGPIVSDCARAGQGGLEHGAVGVAGAEGHDQEVIEALGRVLLGDAVARQDDAHVVAALGQGGGERAGDVGEAAGLRERDALGDDEEDVEAGHRWAAARDARGEAPPSGVSQPRE